MILARRHRPLAASVLALFALYTVAAWRYYDDGFFSLQVLANLLTDNAMVGVMAVGMTFVIVSGGIDLSVGAVMSLTSIAIAAAMTHAEWPAWAAISGGMALGTAFGGAMGAIIHYTGIKPFIVTLAGMFFARGLGFFISLEAIGIGNEQHGALAGLAWMPASLAGRDGFLYLSYVPLHAFVFPLVVVIGAWVARYTAFGRSVYAVGGDEEAARLMGIPLGRTKVLVYALSGFCSGLAGVLLTLYLSSGSHVEGIGLELDVIAAVVIGGTLLSGGVGNPLGTLVGVLIIGIILNVITTYEGGFSAGFTRVVIGGLLLVFVLLQRLLAPRDVTD